MKHETMQIQIQQALNAELSSLRTSSLQRDELYQNAVGGIQVKRKLTTGLVLTIVLVLATLTAVAVGLLTGTQIIEQFAVPMALQNDSEDFRQESFDNEELAQLVQVLEENGITLEEDSDVLKALKNGQSYWEEETLMEICRLAFDGLFYEWSVEEKHWFDEMTVKIGFKEKNPYAIPEEGDMSIAQAKELAVKLLKDAYNVELPSESDDIWQLCEWFYAPWTDEDGFHPAMWKFQYVNRKTGTYEYIVRFDREGGSVETEEACFHGGLTNPISYEQVSRYMSDKYGSKPDWPMSAWAEFAELMASLPITSEGQWYYQHAGYREPPEDAMPAQDAIQLAQQDIGMVGEIEPSIICCTVDDQIIYKVTLRIHMPGRELEGSYDAIWCIEMDCRTGEIIDKREYRYAESDAKMMYVPFSVLDCTPVFETGNG